MRPPTLPPPPRLWWTGKLWRINVPHCVTVGLCPGVVRSLAGQKDKKCRSRFQAEGARKRTRAQNLPPSVGKCRLLSPSVGLPPPHGGGAEPSLKFNVQSLKAEA